jgi:predicted nuclease of predicted toxin-antitoxin system
MRVTFGLLGLSEAGDRDVWDYAKANGFTIVSQDVDFSEMAALLGSPPKVVWLRGGNQSTAAISSLIRHHAELIMAFGNDDDTACLEIY